MTSVTVAVCSYESAETLGATLDSALCQSLPPRDYEVLLVDDGSTDRTEGLAKAYCERYPSLQYMRFPTNRGLVAACNYALDSAQGKYFIRLDADDTFHRDILSCLLAPLERDETDFVYCDRYEVSPTDGEQRLVSLEQFNLFDLIAIGTMLRTDMMRQVGGYRPVFWEEYDLYLRYLQCSRRQPVRIPRPLYHYARHPSSMTADAARVRQGWEELKAMWGEQVLRKFGWQEPDQYERG